jgi:DNA-binding winged helix-turn-helix (wHTH) protein
MERLRAIQRVDLVREEDFMLGKIRVWPSRCEVEAAGQRRDLERRVMQVLVALAHPTWEVVSRQELIERCWSGLSVSDDAIHRCISALRRLAAAWPEPPFEIETISRVGYFLKPTETLRQASPGRLPMATPIVSLAARTDLHQVA